MNPLIVQWRMRTHSLGCRNVFYCKMLRKGELFCVQAAPLPAVSDFVYRKDNTFISKTTVHYH